MRNDRSKTVDPNLADAGLLQRLSSSDPGPAWAEFLDRYSQLIMHTANQFEYRRDQATECYLYVCDQLHRDGFRRLQKFNTSGTSKFRTWLGTVVFNLCVDWHRLEFGRVTLLPAVSALPAFDRAVYRMIIEHGEDKETCFQTLLVDFPDLTRELVERSVLRSYALLTPHQRWQVSVRNRRMLLARGHSLEHRIERLPDPGNGPEEQAQKQQELDNLQQALARLPAPQRLLLRLRFQEGVSLGKIAEMAKLGDTNRAWRHLQAALKALFQELHSNDSKKIRKT